MSIPAFTDEGLLPPGCHPATVEEVRERFVDAFPESATRAAIFTFWQHHRAATRDLVTVHADLLDGSFVTDKQDPADLDLVALLDGPAYDELPVHRRQLVASLFAGPHTEAVWQCDAQPVAVYPEGDLAHARTVLARRFWSSYFAGTRDGGEKGFLEVA